MGSDQIGLGLEWSGVECSSYGNHSNGHSLKKEWEKGAGRRDGANWILILLPSARHPEEGLISVPVVSLEVVEQYLPIVRLHGAQSSGHSKSYHAVPCFACDT